MNANGFLSNIGCLENKNKVTETSLIHSRLVSCNILLGIGVGQQDHYASNKMPDQTLYFFTWVLPQL